jgi:hypothetical protein
MYKKPSIISHQPYSACETYLQQSSG